MMNSTTYNLYDYSFKMTYCDKTLYELRIGKRGKELGQKTTFTDSVFTQLKEYLEGRRKAFDIKYEVSGTEFQKKVWNEIARIPYGKTLSYKEIALRIGNENAQRAVGNASNKNKLVLIIPCHRVVGSNGKLTGYAAGLDIKKRLLDLEKKHLL